MSGEAGDSGTAAVGGVDLEGEPGAHADQPQDGGRPRPWRRCPSAPALTVGEQAGQHTKRCPPRRPLDEDEVVPSGGDAVQVLSSGVSHDPDREDEPAEGQAPAADLQQHDGDKGDVD